MSSVGSPHPVLPREGLAPCSSLIIILVLDSLCVASWLSSWYSTSTLLQQGGQHCNLHGISLKLS